MWWGRCRYAQVRYGIVSHRSYAANFSCVHWIENIWPNLYRASRGHDPQVDWSYLVSLKFLDTARTRIHSAPFEILCFFPALPSTVLVFKWKCVYDVKWFNCVGSGCVVAFFPLFLKFTFSFSKYLFLNKLYTILIS